MTDAPPPAAEHPCPCGCGMRFATRSNAEMHGRLHGFIQTSGLFGRQARWRYFQRGRGPMFCWTTERVGEKYESFVMQPVGKGSRSNAAVNFERDTDQDSRHRLRKDAKARALKLYEAWKAEQS